MAWNPKSELVKKAAEIAKRKHPEGFNKSQLIDAADDVYGGMGRAVLSPGTAKLRTMEDVNNMANAMANIDGHYPVGMSGCFTVGINGGCGYECPVFLSGGCDEFETQMLKDLLTDEPELRQDGPSCPDEIAAIFEAVGVDMQEFIEDQI